jgi:hypothetical protein
MDWVSARGWIFRGGHGEKELRAQALRYAPAVDVILNGHRVEAAGLSAPSSHDTLSR